jgi:hypothetical protein
LIKRKALEEKNYKNKANKKKKKNKRKRKEHSRIISTGGNGERIHVRWYIPSLHINIDVQHNLYPRSIKRNQGRKNKNTIFLLKKGINDPARLDYIHAERRR